jgi:hypothetical protein
MSSKELDNLVRVGLLKKEPGDQGEFNGLVKSGRTRLNDARTPGLSPESRFDLAYNAAHAFALAALRWHGFRPDNKRYVVFQSLEHSLGLKPELWRVLDKVPQRAQSRRIRRTLRCRRAIAQGFVARDGDCRPLRRKTRANIGGTQIMACV